MSHLLAASDLVIQAARAAGMRVTDDPRSVNPPCVLVTPATTERVTSVQVDVTVTATLVAPGPANADALRKLDALADQLTPALDAAGIPWTSGRVGAFTSPSSGEELLGYALTLTPTTEA